MLKTLTAYTLEIDEVDTAVEEILEQLDLPHNQLKNTVGIISCYSEFVESGVVKALCGRLPFDVVGATTLGNAVPGERSALMLTLAVLTSDDIEFSTAVSASLASEQEQALSAVYRQAAAPLSAPPSMMMSFMALIYNVGGDVVLDLMDKISGGVPNFGTVTVDHTPDYHTAQVIHNGECYSESLSLLLLSGDVQPSFYVASISETKIMRQKAIITEAQGNVLIKVNDMPILSYMETLGLAKEGRIDGANAIPFIIDYNDGTRPIARAIYALTPEGYAVCGGVMPLGATLSVGTIDYEDVIATTKKALGTMLATSKNGGLLMFSCLSRLLALGVETEAEMETMQTCVGDAAPYQFSYSGGEICPVYDTNGKLVNRFHNDTFIACVF